MKLMDILTPIITGIFGIIIALIHSRLSFNAKTKKRKNLFDIIKEMEYLKLDDKLRQSVINDYIELVILEAKGLRISLEKYNIILNSGVLDKFSNSQVRIASKFFIYPDNMLGVTIPWKERFSATTFFISSLIIIAIGFGILFFTIYKDYNILKYLAIFAVSILTMLFGFLTIAWHVAPVNVARLIKKSL